LTSVLLLLATVMSTSRVMCSEAERSLYRELFDSRDYDEKIRPVKYRNETIAVHMSLTLQQIVDLDEKNQILTTSMYPTWKWTDAFLAWTPQDYDNITHIFVPSKYVWKPDILIYNSAVDAFNAIYPSHCIIHFDGTVEWMPPGLFKTTCDVDIRYFPFDDQRCKIKFGTWAYDSEAVNLVLEKTSADYVNLTSKEWKLISMNGKRNSVKYPCCIPPFVDITYTLHIRRTTLFYGFNLILPCFLVNSLAVLVFLLPADSGERITLSITILLALVVFLQILAETLPPTDVIPLLGNYFASSIVMVTSSVLITVISLNFHHTNAANANAMSKYIRWLFLGVLPAILRIKRPGEISHKRMYIDHVDQDPNSLLIDETKIQIPLLHIRKRKKWDSPNGKKLQQPKSAEGIYKQMGEILKELTFITDRIHNDDEDEKCALEWKFAAQVLDTAALWFFILYFIFTTFLTIGMAPGILLSHPPDHDHEGP